MKRAHGDSVLERMPWFLVWALGIACNDFPQEPAVEISIEPAGMWPTTMAVTDTAAVAVKLIDDTGRSYAGVVVEWSSSRPEVLAVVRSPAPDSMAVAGGPCVTGTPCRPTNRADSLAAQLKAMLTARRSGEARITAVVAQNGIERTDTSVTITVDRWLVQAADTWPDRLTVTETDTLELEIPNADATVGNELRVTWQSTNDAILSVTRAIPPDDANSDSVLAAKRRAVITAHRHGSASVTAIVERSGFEQGGFSGSITVMSLAIDTIGTWPDTMVVSDVDTLEVAITDHNGNPITGRVQWHSSSPSRLRVVGLDSVRAEIRVDARGSAQVVAFVAEDGFEAVQVEHDIRMLERWIAVSAGSSHTCGITFNFEAYCWGIGLGGALGNGRTTGTLVPSRVVPVGDLGFQSVSAGRSYSCATIFTAYCWGHGERGALGNGDSRDADQLAPGQVSGGREFGLVSTGGTASGGVTCAVDNARQARCWGDNDRWQLGVDINDLDEAPLETCPTGSLIPCARVPRRVGTAGVLPDQYWAVDVGGFHTCGLSYPDSTAFCWGKHPFALGNTFVDSSRTPFPVSSLGKARFISAGDQHACAIAISYEAYCWGSGLWGRLGHGDEDSHEVPVVVNGSHRFVAVSAGDLHTCALTEQGTAWCWGRGVEGQLGNGSSGVMNIKTEPDSVAIDHTFASISAGAFHTCAVALGIGAGGVKRKTITGAIFCWGEGIGGRLGDSTGVRRPAPVRVSEPP